MAERTDTERIDWLEKTQGLILHRETKWVQLDTSDGVESATIGTIRQAIDAAMDREAEDAKQD